MTIFEYLQNKDAAQKPKTQKTDPARKLRGIVREELAHAFDLVAKEEEEAPEAAQPLEGAPEAPQAPEELAPAGAQDD